MKDRWNKKQIAILHVLHYKNKPISSPQITEILVADSIQISERTVRYLLDDLCKKGCTEKKEKKGFCITKKGFNELNARTIIKKVGFLSSRIDSMSYKMTFNPDLLEGTVIVNLSVVDPDQITELIPLFKKVFEKNLAMGKLLLLLGPGEELGNIKIPEKMIGIGTVCSFTMNGVLLKAGVPVHSKFGGILALEENKPVGFVDIIMYNGTSMDPLEIFIRSGMTDYIGAIKTGRGRVGASFREIPAETSDIVQSISQKMKKASLGVFALTGLPGKSLLQIPVNENCLGAIIMGGLNPIAVFEETGVRIQSRAFSGLTDYNRLFHYSEFDKKLKQL